MTSRPILRDDRVAEVAHHQCARLDQAAALDAVGEGAPDGVQHAPDGGVGIGVGVNERQVARPLARQVMRWRGTFRRRCGPAHVVQPAPPTDRMPAPTASLQSSRGVP